MKTIQGKVSYQNLGTGFWGIIGQDGQQWRPVNMPEQLKKEGRQVSLTAKEVDDISVFMWGTAIRILSFTT